MIIFRGLLPKYRSLDYANCRKIMIITYRRQTIQKSLHGARRQKPAHNSTPDYQSRTEDKYERGTARSGESSGASWRNSPAASREMDTRTVPNKLLWPSVIATFNIARQTGRSVKIPARPRRRSRVRELFLPLLPPRWRKIAAGALLLRFPLVPLNFVEKVEWPDEEVSSTRTFLGVVLFVSCDVLTLRSRVSVKKGRIIEKVTIRS
ncbi:hypothetical protein GWI33_001841 [Rhynchophorus ferrugineus]|uniref:Uncharacterized protein n=1 Tax=Rhynchophorus ferrugineus TaxID=354439 RepID=A0A834ISA9_RHYFE|nr:hypothetical protein GWI33_001841 [Rhynchophorus ferrugineus]